MTACSLFRSHVRIAFLSAGMLLSAIHGAVQAQTSSPHNANVILEVVNKHITVGKKIPSLFLRLFSDGTVECSTVRFGENDNVTTKEGRLKPEELAEAKEILNDPLLRDVNGRYELHRLVFDSWMEWDIKIEIPQFPHDVTVSFHGASERAYPEALGKLSCIVLKTRQKIYGDNTRYYYPACSDPLSLEVMQQH